MGILLGILGGILGGYLAYRHAKAVWDNREAPKQFESLAGSAAKAEVDTQVDLSAWTLEELKAARNVLVRHPGARIFPKGLVGIKGGGGQFRPSGCGSVR